MQILVLGAGVVGVTTAYYLWRDGHDVTVVDRQLRPAMESSWGNAGGLCPSFAGPWAAPGMVGKVVKMTLAGNSPIRFSLWPDPERLRWVRQWVANCNAERFPGNKSRMQRVAHYSLQCLRQLADDTGLEHDFDFHGDGTLQLFRTAQERELGQLSARTLAALGIAHQLLDAEAAARIEPAIAACGIAWSGALHMPIDASGDSHKFSVALAGWLAARGVRFRYDTPIHALHTDGQRLVGVEVGAARERLAPQACVVALGSHAPRLLRPIGLELPVYPLKGYSLTLPITDAGAAPRVAIMDEHNKIMVSRLGDRLRVAGMAELVGHDLSQPDSRRRLLLELTRALFPRGIDYDRAQFWAGLRPMTPDGPPVLGPTRIAGLHLNAGHGSNGWTQACGTSRVVADLVAGRTPGIDTEGLTGERYGLTR